MYQALYRKYRPANFNDVVGQDVIVKTLKNAIINNKLTHAYLFAGPRGTGKTSLAKILAKTINCLDLSNGITCEKCVSCTQINQKNFVDIIEIDAASNNGVDEIRELRNKVNLVPSFGKYKVYIIDEVHMLTTGAFNALLKTLEEPPAHIIFVLATTEPQKIPATILSRCQRFDFKRMSDDAIFERIKYIAEKENISINDNDIREIARLSDGGMRDALSILDQVTSYCEGKITTEDIHMVNGTVTKDKIAEFIEKLINRDLSSMLNFVGDWTNNGKNIYKIFEDIMLLLKNTLIYIKAPQYFENNEEDMLIYKEISEQLSEEYIMLYLNILSDNLYKIKKMPNMKILLELTIIKMVEATADKEKISNEQNVVEPTVKEEKKKIKINNNFVSSKENRQNVDNDYVEKLKNVKDIRINNTLAEFDKKQLINLKSKQDDLKPLLINLDYSKYVSIILDGELKAASNDNLVYVYESAETSDIFNENIKNIENVLELVLGKKYKVIATDIISWEIIKKEFNSKSKTYTVIEEPANIDLIFNTDKDDNEIENLFKNEITYN